VFASGKILSRHARALPMVQCITATILVMGCGRFGYETLAPGDRPDARSDAAPEDGYIGDGALSPDAPRPDGPSGDPGPTWLSDVVWIDGAGTSIAQRSSGNVLLAGECDLTASTRICLLEVDSDGSVVWELGLEEATRSLSVERILVTPGDGFATVGVRGIVAFNPDRSIRWTRDYDSPDERVVVRSGAVTHDGDIVVVGVHTGAGVRNRELPWAARVSKDDGSVLWSVRRGTLSNYTRSLYAATVMTDGHIGVAGCLGGASTSTFLVAKLDVATGQPIWQTQQTTPTSRDCPYTIAAAPDGGVAVTTNVAVIRLGPAGELMWSSVVPLDNFRRQAVSVTFDGHLLLAGQHATGVCSLLKLDRTGSSVHWHRLITPAGGTGAFTAIAELGNGDILTTASGGCTARLGGNGDIEAPCEAVAMGEDTVSTAAITTIAGKMEWNEPPIVLVDPAITQYDPGLTTVPTCH
jgi:hypothetical protein